MLEPTNYETDFFYRQIEDAHDIMLSFLYMYNATV